LLIGDYHQNNPQMGNFPDQTMGFGLGEKKSIWLLGHVAGYSIEEIKPMHESKFRLQLTSGWYTSGKCQWD
jgi:hypothetical protein